MKRPKTTIATAKAGKRKQPDRSAGANHATQQETLETLRDRVDSLKLELAKKKAEAKTGIQSDDTRLVYKALVADAPVRVELERQIKDTEQRLAERAKGQDLTRNKQGLNANDILLDDAALRMARLRELTKRHSGCTNRELCGHFDDYSISVPPSWSRAGIKSWVEAYDRRDHTTYVNSYINKLKKP
jgi:hypothetical protein